MNKQSSKRNQNFMKGKQSRKDSKVKRVNYDNTRESKFNKDTREQDKVDRDVSQRRTGHSNNISWWNHNQEMMKAAASIPFSTFIGEASPYSNNQALAGLMCLHFMPSFDEQLLKYAAADTYSFTVHANSRNTSYTDVDQMLMIIAGSQVFTAIAKAVKAYGVAKKYEGTNYYTPDTILSAMGFKPDDIRANLSDMWFDINLLIAQSRQIWIPDSFPFLERYYWMASEIYKDADSAKAQLYMYDPRSFLCYNETTDPNGGKLELVTYDSKIVDFANNSYTWAEYTVIVKTMIDRLLNSEDRGLIFGDMLKAYGSEHIYVLDEVPVTFQLQYVYDREVLLQMHNATSIDIFGTTELRQVDGQFYVDWFAKYTPSTDTFDYRYATIEHPILDLPSGIQSTPEVVEIATRLQLAEINIKLVDSSMRIYLRGPGTDYITHFSIYFFKYVDGKPVITKQKLHSLTLETSLTADILSAYSNFDWAPLLYYIVGYDQIPSDIPTVMTPLKLQPKGVIGDVDNFLYNNYHDLYHTHTVAVYSAYNVPTMR